MKHKLKPTTIPSQDTQSRKYYPFENCLDLCCMVRLLKDNRDVGAYLLNRGNLWQLVFGFKLQGLHPELTREEVIAIATQLEEAMKDCAIGESLRFYFSCFANDSDRQQSLEQLINRTEVPLAIVLGRSEQKRIQQLTHEGTRRHWSLLIFCTYTINASGQARWSDWISKLSQRMTHLLDAMRGGKHEQSQQFLHTLMDNGYDAFLNWERLLNTKAGLEITPLKAENLWNWVWQHFNRSTAPPIPQLLIWQPTIVGTELVEITQSERHSTTILIQGSQGQSACPEHRQNRECVWVNRRVGGLLVMQDAVDGWINTRTQLAAMWKAMSQPYVRDTEVWVEIVPASRFSINDNLVQRQN